MKLVPLSENDEELAVRLECDPIMTVHLGGPRAEGEVRASHRNRLKLMGSGKAYMYKIVENGDLGTVGYWEADWEGPRCWEMGWMVLPEHQGRGIATKAARKLIEMARESDCVLEIHAYPPIANAPSNVIARKLGMRNIGEFENEGYGGVIQCNHWMIRLNK